MSEASCLLSLQQVDLQISRARQTLANPPELKAYRDALTTRKRVEALLTTLKGQHKDLDMDLADLDEEQRLAKEAIEEVRRRGEDDAANYRSLADVREQYSSLAKKLEKSEYRSERTMERLIDLEAREARANEALERCHAEERRSAAAVRESLARSQREIDGLEAERERLASGLSEETLAAYGSAYERFDGLCVERLDGRSPSICRVSLQPDAIKLVHRAGPVTRCPYCRRILVVDGDDG